MKKESKMNYAVKVNGETVGYVIRTRLGWRPCWGPTRTPIGGSILAAPPTGPCGEGVALHDIGTAAVKAAWPTADQKHPSRALGE